MKNIREEEEHKMSEMVQKIKRLKSERDQVKVENEKLKTETDQLQYDDSKLMPKPSYKTCKKEFQKKKHKA